MEHAHRHDGGDLLRRQARRIGHAPGQSGPQLFAAYFGTSSAFQTIDLTLLKDRIDSGGVGYQLSGYLGGFEDSNDSGKLSLVFLDANGREPGNAAVGPVTAEDRGNKSGLLKRAGEGAVPAGTRQLRLTLTLLFTDDVTSGMYAYADNISLVLTSGVSAVSLNRISNAGSFEYGVHAGVANRARRLHPGGRIHRTRLDLRRHLEPQLNGKSRRQGIARQHHLDRWRPDQPGGR